MTKTSRGFLCKEDEGDHDDDDDDEVLSSTLIQKAIDPDRGVTHLAFQPQGPIVREMTKRLWHVLSLSILSRH